MYISVWVCQCVCRCGVWVCLCDVLVWCVGVRCGSGVIRGSVDVTCGSVGVQERDSLREQLIQGQMARAEEAQEMLQLRNKLAVMSKRLVGLEQQALLKNETHSGSHANVPEWAETNDRVFHDLRQEPHVSGWIERKELIMCYVSGWVGRKELIIMSHYFLLPSPLSPLPLLSLSLSFLFCHL